MVSFTPQPLYPKERPPSHTHLLDRRLGGPQSWPGHCGEEKNICLCQESIPGFLAVQLVSCRYTEISFWWMKPFDANKVILHFVRFETFTAVVMKSSIFWDRKPCSLLKVNRRFGKTRRLACYLLHVGFSSGLFFDPEDGGDTFLRNVGWLSKYYLSVCLSVCLSIYLSIYGSTALCWALAAFSVSRSFTQSVGHLGRGIGPSQGHYLHIGQHRQNKRTQTPLPRVGFEPMIPVFERAETVHALDRAETVIGTFNGLHGVIFQKTELFIPTGVRTSDPISSSNLVPHHSHLKRNPSN
jgi:hypothetical protein